MTAERAPDLVESREDAEFHALMAKIARERGFGCGSYKDKCLRRRVAVRMRATGVHGYAAYARVLDADPGEYDRLLDALTINVTKLFRNWEVYAAIADQIVPAMWELPGDLLVWSAGCASGEEAYSLAILFHRHAQARGELPRLHRVRIIGTDIDQRSLALAARASYDSPAFADTPEELRRRYFSSGPPHTVAAEIRSMVTFERRDLLREAPPAGCQLVVCRNVLIYFGRDTQELLFERFHAALAPSGWLVLGKVETLLGRARTLFAAVNARERLFRRA